MTDWTPQDDWSQVNRGDTVRAMRAEQMLTGEVVDRLFSSLFHNDNIYALVLKVPDLADVLQIHQGYWQLSVPAKPAVVLPDEAGHYLDRKGGGWEILQGATSSLPQELAPYTRLEPIAVTAKKVLDWIESAEWSPNVQLPGLLSATRHEFGVTE